MQKSENNKNLIKEEPKKQEIQPNILKESNSKKTFNEPENKPKETIKTNQIDNKNTNQILQKQTKNEQKNNTNEQKKLKRNATVPTTFVPISYTGNNKKTNNTDKDTSVSSSENEKNNKKKSRRGMSALNIISESQDILRETFNDVEKYNAKKILKGYLSEVFQDVIKENADFKDNIFFVNVGHTEKKVGDLDNNIKLHTIKEFPRQELLSGYNPYDQLLKKYIDRAKRYKKEDK